MNYADPFGLSPDTLSVDSDAQPIVDTCKAVSPTCAREIDLLSKEKETTRISVGRRGDCGPNIIVGCYPTPGGRNRITLIPEDERSSEASLGIRVTSVHSLAHEMGHALTDRYKVCSVDERCAIQHENALRRDLGETKMRPLPPGPGN